MKTINRIIFTWGFILLGFAVTQSISIAAVLEVGSGYPYALIQDAIDNSVSGDEVLVYDGIYQENIDFLGKGITVHSANGALVTIIDGMGSSTVINFENSEGPDSVLDGFTIQNGSSSYGGGIRCWNLASPTIINCIISNNLATDSGAGIFCQELCSPVISDCTIMDNTANHNGGGIYYDTTEASIERCIISGNTAQSGAGIYNDHSELAMVNCRISGNYASYNGGGVFCFYGVLSITNCTVYGNIGYYYGGGISCYQSSALALNCIVWKNLAFGNPNDLYIGASSLFHINYSDFNSLAVDGSYTGFFNINAAPLLVNPMPPVAAPTSDGDYHLTHYSPCIDAGTGMSRRVPSDDIDSDSRPQSGSWLSPPEYDMGSDEYVLTFSPFPNPSLPYF